MRPYFRRDRTAMKTEPSQSDRRLEKTIAVLFEIADAVSHAPSLTDLYQVIHTALGTILPADNFFIALCDESEDSIRFSYVRDQFNEAPEKAAGMNGTASFIGRVMRSRSPMIFSENESRAMPEHDGTTGRIPRIWMGAPLVVRQRVIGVMGILDYTPDMAYGLEDESLLNSVAQHVALAIERKEAEAKIREQRRITEKILESSPVGIALVQNRIFKWVNAEMVRMFGYGSKKEFQDRSVKMIYKAEADFDFAGKTIYQGLSSQGKVDYEMDLMRSDNTLFPVHVRLNSTDGDDPMAWTIGTFTDISERRVAEKETVERERLHGVLEMAGAVCHEINQPLQAIIGYSELLEMEPELAQGGNTIRAIKSQATRLGRITATLSNITRYKTVEYPGKTKIVDIWGAAPSSRAFKH